MTVKVILLKTNEYLISEIEEREDVDADCVLVNPKTIVRNYIYNDEEKIPGGCLEFGSETFGNDTAKVYITLDNYIDYTYQKQIPIRSSDIMTIVEPRDDLLKYYREVVG